MKDIRSPHNVVPFARDAGFLRARAQNHARAGRMLEALELYRLRAAREPENALLLLELAAQYSDMGAYELSNRLLFMLLQRGEHELACFFTLGSNFYAMQDTRRAQDCLLACARLQPESQFSEEIDAMLDQLDEVTLNHRGEHRTEKAMTRGLRALEAGEAARAVRWISYALRGGGSDAEGLALLSFAYLSADRPREALGCARRAHGKNKRSVHALCAMACSLYALNSPLLCAKYLDMAEAEASLPQEIAMLCQAACETGAHDLVLLLLRAVHAEQPYTPSLLHMLAAACWNTGQVRQALQHWATLRRLDPDNLVAAVMHDHAKLRVQQGDAQEPPEMEEQCGYRMELTVTDSIAKLLDVHQTLRKGVEELQRRFDEDAEFASVIAWGLTVQDENDATRFAMLSLLGTLRGERAERLLLMQLTELEQSEGIKREAMALLARRGLCGPYYMENDGRVVRVMGQVLPPRMVLSPSCERILQAAVDRLTPRYGDVVRELSEIWLPYVQRRENPSAPLSHARIWIAALEYAYCVRHHVPVDLRGLCARQRISPRNLLRYARRFALEPSDRPQEGE